jgi:hypothetical protein
MKTYLLSINCDPSAFFSFIRHVKSGATTLVAGVLAFTVFLGLTASAAATPIFPQIIVDSRQGPGQNLFTTQGFHYTAGVGWAGSAKALAITFDGITFTPLVNGTVDSHAAFAGASFENGVITGLFLPENDGLPGLVLADATGLLLGGPYTKRNVSGVSGANQGTGVGSWIVTGGSLAPFFFAATGGANASYNYDLFDVTPLFSQNSFNSNFDSQFAGVIAPALAPVPEPSSLTLLGFGILAMLGYGCRRRS